MKHRLFIAAILPRETTIAIGKIQADLEAFGLPLRPEPPEKLHITFNFLGRIDEEKISDINGIISKTAASFSPLELVPSFMDSMYNKHADSYVYLGLSGDTDTLKSIYKSLSLSLSQISIPMAERYFPHITIARFQKSDPVTIKSAMDKIDQYEFNPLPAFTLDNISLYESLLSQKGSFFRLIGQQPLR